jgi:hypothetical protein
MYFKLVLSVDSRPNLRRRAADLVKTIYPDLEARFWKDLQRAPKSPELARAREDAVRCLN